jgi:hypothetical protein
MTEEFRYGTYYSLWGFSGPFVTQYYEMFKQVCDSNRIDMATRWLWRHIFENHNSVF